MAQLEPRKEAGLRYLDLAELAHAFAPFLLLLEQFALSRDVAAIAFGKDVLAEGLDRLARDDAAADRRLNGDLEELPRDEVLQALAQCSPAFLSGAAVDDEGERVDRLAIDENVEQDDVALLVAIDLVVKAGVAAADRFEPVIEVEDNLVERQAIDHHRAVAGVGQILLYPAPLLAQGQHRAEIVVGDEDRRLDPRLLDMVDAHRVRHVGGVVQHHHLAIGEMHLVDDRRRGGNQVEVEFALEALLDDLEMKKAEKAAAEAEAERRRGLRLIFETGVVEAQFRQAVAQPLVIGGIGREEPAEHHRLDRLEAGQRLGGRAAVLGDGVADAAIGPRLDPGGGETDLARAEVVGPHPLWGGNNRAPRRLDDARRP